MIVPEYLKESNEFQGVIVDVDGARFLGAIFLGTSMSPTVPATFDEAVTIGDEIGVMTGGRDVGLHYIFTKVVSSPEIPVRLAGAFRIK